MKKPALRKQIDLLREAATGSGSKVPNRILIAASSQSPGWVNRQDEMVIRFIGRGAYTDEVIGRTATDWLKVFKEILIHPNLVKRLEDEYKKSSGEFSFYTMNWLINNPDWDGVPERTIEESQKMIQQILSERRK